MTLRVRATLAVAIVATLTACGGNTYVSAGSNDDSGITSDSSTAPDTGAPIDGGADVAKPQDSGTVTSDAIAPKDSSTLADTGGGGMSDANGSGCPNVEPSGLCSTNDETCYYTAAACICSTGSPPSQSRTWHCLMLPAGCPATPPMTGTACSPDGLDCDYGQCIGGAEYECSASHWKIVITACPQ